MRNTLIFSGTSCPALTGKICENLGMAPAEAELSQFSNVCYFGPVLAASASASGETSVRILTSVREKDVFVVQSGSPKINDTIMELLIMISACKGGSANKITAVLPYFPYSRQSKKKSHRGAITARMLANLLHVAGVKHVITVDLHASQMQGFFKCPVDNLHAEPLIARWIRRNVPNWKDAVVVSKNAGGTKRVTSLADALKLNFGIVTTDRRRAGTNMTASMIMNQLDGFEEPPSVNGNGNRHSWAMSDDQDSTRSQDGNGAAPTRHIVADSQGSPRSSHGPPLRTNGLTRSPFTRALHTPSQTSPIDELGEDEEEAQDYNDERAQVVTHGRLVQGHIVPDDYPSGSQSEAGGEGSQSYQATEAEDTMAMSHASSFFAPEPHALGGSGDAEPSSDEEDEKLQDPKLEHMITLVGDVKNRFVLIVDDMIDKPSSWIAAAETVVKRGHAKKVYCMATHGVFGGDCLEQLQACECIDQIIVTNSFPISERKARDASKLVILDLSFLLSEAIRRNHYGESISPLFQHIVD
ncbi:phosphoribosyltransferase-like protein [Pseudomassariella vexata]|uniref:Ribose-phosphate pyrophosphokinase 1 n=1 Tax=Pseudomassariella vexata TaxID=1141098 RepID=A0A1Y2E1S4_9PEZI|nr:phosphoribosyltransferase-like protein [Pseudomassariella vexata]ORY65503.1 phosphoribosyltransferase-like protein [Pseudomassariella vexata]